MLTNHRKSSQVAPVEVAHCYGRECDVGPGGDVGADDHGVLVEVADEGVDALGGEDHADGEDGEPVGGAVGGARLGRVAQAADGRAPHVAHRRRPSYSQNTHLYELKLYFVI